MALFPYSYNITGSFPNQIFAKDTLYVEVLDSGIVPALFSIDADLIDLTFNFKGSLSAPELVILNNIVAYHSGVSQAEQITADQGTSGSLPWVVTLGTASINITTPTGSFASVTGSVAVTNFPNVQTITGSVFQINQPVTQSVYVGGSTTLPVTVANFPATQTVTGTVHIDNSVLTTTGSVTVNNFPVTQSVFVVNQTSTTASISNFPLTQSVYLVNTSVTQSVTGTMIVPNVVTITGSVFQINQPLTQSVKLDQTITVPVSISNTPTITGSVTINNPTVLPTTQSVKIDQSITLPISVSNFPAVQTITGTVATIVTFPSTQNVNLVGTVVTQSVTGTVFVNNSSFNVNQAASGSFAWKVTLFDGNNNNPITSSNPLWITGSVIQINQPVTQSVFVGNVVTVTGNLASTVTFPPTQSVKLVDVGTNVTQSITGSVTVNNFPITQSVFVGNVVTITGSTTTNVVFPPTQSVNIVASAITQSVTGSFFQINQPVTQSVYLAAGNAGFASASPLWVTGTMTTVQKGGTTTVTIDSNYETYSALALSTAVALNKSMMSIYNGSANRVVKISSVKLINSQITTVNGVILEFRFLRMTGHSVGTLITPQTFDTVDSLDANITVRTGATIAGEAATPLFRYYWSGDEWGAASSKIEGTDHAYQTLVATYSRKLNEKPITLRPGEGLTIKQLTNTVIGTFDIELIFTEE